MKNFMLTALCFIFMCSLNSQTFNIGSYESAGTNIAPDYGWTLNGFFMQDALAKLKNPANFGSGGTIDCVVNDQHYGIGSLTQTDLDNTDVFFIGFIQDGFIPQSELDLLDNWVLNGGTIFITADASSFDDVAEKFGHPTSSTQGGTNLTLATTLGLNHPFFDGPFGTIASFGTQGLIGVVTNEAGTDVLAEYSNGFVNLIEKSYGSGHVIISGDVCAMSRQLSPGNGVNNSNDIYYLNTFAYLKDLSAPPVCQDILTSTTTNVVVWENLPSNIEGSSGPLSAYPGVGNSTYDLFDSNGNLIADDITILPDDLILGETYLLKGNDLPAGSLCEDGLTEFKVLSLGCTNP